jgi:hypothetical protein
MNDDDADSQDNARQRPGKNVAYLSSSSARPKIALGHEYDRIAMDRWLPVMPIVLGVRHPPAVEAGKCDGQVQLIRLMGGIAHAGETPSPGPKASSSFGFRTAAPSDEHGALAYQSPPSIPPSFAMQARPQVVREMLGAMERTLPSPRPTTMTVCPVCVTDASQFAIDGAVWNGMPVPTAPMAGFLQKSV